MHARDLTSEDVGRDLTIIVSRIATGGIIEKVATMAGMVSVTMEGTTFVLDADKPVELTPIKISKRPLTELDLDVRHRILASAGR